MNSSDCSTSLHFSYLHTSSLTNQPTTRIVQI